MKCFVGSLNNRRILIAAESRSRAAEVLEVEPQAIQGFEQRPAGSWMEKDTVYEMNGGDWEKSKASIRLNHLPYAVAEVAGLR